VVGLALIFLTWYIAMSTARCRFSGRLSPKLLRAIIMLAVAHTSRPHRERRSECLHYLKGEKQRIISNSVL
jgi:hypothetical protein